MNSDTGGTGAFQLIYFTVFPTCQSWQLRQSSATSDL